MADVLVLAPHMDDETLGCGGVLAIANDPLVVFGVWSRDPEVEVQSVAEILGFRFEVLYGSEYEARLLSVDRRDLVGRVEAILHKEKPERVFLPSPSYHQDHNVLFEVGLAATRPLSREGYVAPFVASFEYPGSAWRVDAGEENLNYYLDISQVMDRKLQAAAEYRSQAGRAIISTSVVESWARLRGAFVGLEYAEAFRIVRQVERQQNP